MRVVQWIRPRTLTCEVPGSNPLAPTVCALGQGTLSSLHSFPRGLKFVGPLVICLQATCFLSGQVKQNITNQILVLSQKELSAILKHVKHEKVRTYNSTNTAF